MLVSVRAYFYKLISINSYFPVNLHAWGRFFRSNLALLHFTDILRCTSKELWASHLPVLLHVAVLGLDSSRPVICCHARQTIINIVILYAVEYVSASRLSNILLRNQVSVGTWKFTVSSCFRACNGKQSRTVFSLSFCECFRRKNLDREFVSAYHVFLLWNKAGESRCFVYLFVQVEPAVRSYGGSETWVEGSPVSTTVIRVITKVKRS